MILAPKYFFPEFGEGKIPLLCHAPVSYAYGCGTPGATLTTFRHFPLSFFEFFSSASRHVSSQRSMAVSKATSQIAIV